MVTTSPAPIAPGNEEQFRAWDGAEGGYWATHADEFDRSAAGYDDALFAAADIGSRDRVLDVGCGAGGTALRAARLAADGTVLGVDLSSAMLAVARRRAAEAGLGNVTFVQADAEVHPFEPALMDVVIGRTSAMFFSDKAAALRNVGRALRPGGRLVLLVWQLPQRNEWFLELTSAMAAGRALPAPPKGGPHPFSMADADDDAALVASAGYEDVAVTEVTAPMVFGADPDEAFDLVRGLLGWMLHGLDDGGRRRALDALRRTIDSHATPEGVRFGSAAWLITARR